MEFYLDHLDTYILYATIYYTYEEIDKMIDTAFDAIKGLL